MTGPAVLTPPESKRPEPILLRDGESARLRLSTPADAQAIAALPWRDGDRPITEHATCSLVVREGAAGEELLGAAGYVRHGTGTVARAAFAVGAEQHGRGIGTLLLEHLADRARDDGITTLRSTVSSDDAAALEVLRDSGLVVAEHALDGQHSFEIAAHPDEYGFARVEERERGATAASLVPLLRPRSVAVIGASRRPGAIGRIVLDRLVSAGFTGAVYPVNPDVHAVAAIRAYPTILDVPDPVDLAVIAVPAAVVPTVVDQCAAHGVRALVVLSAGFAETGEAGRAAQDALVARVRGHGMRMVGPNCLGVFNTDPDVLLNATFGRGLPPRGGLAMSSQSGAMGLAITDYASALGIGLSSFVSVGNKADVSGNDLLQYWEVDPDTHVIALYLESFGNPRKFSRIAKRVGRSKPILAVKSGRTSAGSRAARSHTAALASSDVAADTLFRQAGITRLDTLEELFDVASLLTNQPLPRGNRVAIITNAGGPGILCADACEANGLVVPSLSEQTLEALRAVLPPAAGLTNPIDMIASATPEQYDAVASAVLRDPDVDALIAINIAVGERSANDYARGVRGAVARARAAGVEKPTLACFMSPDGAPSALHPTDGDEAGGAIPWYRFPEAPPRALARAHRYAMWRAREPGRVRVPAGVDPHAARAAIEAARAGCRRRWLDPPEVGRLLGAAGITLPRFAIAATPDEAARTAAEIAFPVAVKLVSSTITHKSDVGGVVLDVPDAVRVREACERMRTTLGDAVEGFLVQAMVSGGHEVLVGVTVDPTFGPLIAFGLGGTAVELLHDIVFRLAPLTDIDAAEMVREIRGFPLLDGYRAAPRADVAALEELLLRVSWLSGVAPELVEMDLNPVRVFDAGAGVRVVDARIALAP